MALSDVATQIENNNASKEAEAGIETATGLAGGPAAAAGSPGDNNSPNGTASLKRTADVVQHLTQSRAAGSTKSAQSILLRKKSNQQIAQLARLASASQSVATSDTKNQTQTGKAPLVAIAAPLSNALPDFNLSSLLQSANFPDASALGIDLNRFVALGGSTETEAPPPATQPGGSTIQRVADGSVLQRSPVDDAWNALQGVGQAAQDAWNNGTHQLQNWAGQQVQTLQSWGQQAVQGLQNSWNGAVGWVQQESQQAARWTQQQWQQVQQWWQANIVAPLRGWWHSNDLVNWWLNGPKEQLQHAWTSVYSSLQAGGWGRYIDLQKLHKNWWNDELFNLEANWKQNTVNGISSWWNGNLRIIATWWSNLYHNPAKLAQDMHDLPGIFVNAIRQAQQNTVNMLQQWWQSKYEALVRGLQKIVADVQREMQRQAAEQAAQQRQRQAAEQAAERQRQIAEQRERERQQAAANSNNVTPAPQVAANSGGQAPWDQIAENIQAINKLKEMFGQLGENGGYIISKIASNPQQFFNNLLQGVTTGLNRFTARLGTNLEAGFVQWLTGAMGNITLPHELTPQSVGMFTLQVLNLDYSSMRGLIVQKLGPRGEQAVSALEQSEGVLRTLATGGPGALFNELREYLADFDMVGTIMGGLKNWLITQVVTRGVEKVAELLVPGGAVLEAAQAVYDLFQSFISNAERIGGLIGSVENAMMSIADGQVGPAATFVEDALKRALPITISFAAQQIGLGNIAQAVRSRISELAQRIHQAISRLIDRVVSWVRQRLPGGRPQTNQPESTVPPSHHEGQSQPGTDTGGEETERSRHVKQKAHDILASHEQQPFNNMVELNAYLHNIQSQLAPEGLKSLSAVKDDDPNTPETEYDIMAVASPPSKVARFKLRYDPATRTLPELWLDCTPNGAVGPNGRRSKENDEFSRYRMAAAEQELVNRLPNHDIVRKILAVDRGESPRPFNSLVDEDGLGLGGHTTEKHVFGAPGAKVASVTELAQRAATTNVFYGGAWVRIGGGKNATAFNSLGDANRAVKKAWNEMKTNWATIRSQLVTGTSGSWLPTPSSGWPELYGSATKLERQPRPAGVSGGGSAYNAPADLPPHYGGTGTRPLYPGDPNSAGLSGSPLTDFRQASAVQVHIVAHPNAPGGWYINTAYPE